ncbi:MAG: choice-of-anchor V domain-containing protein [Acidobacteriota bacterium]
MKRASKKRAYLKLSAIAAAVVLFTAVQSRISPDYQKVSASASGPSASFTGAPGESNCTACHTTFPVNSGTGGVTITGMPSNYRPGQQIPLTVTVSEPDGVLYGFEMTALDNRGRPAGTFNLPGGTPPTLQIVDGFVNGILRDYIEHTIDGVTPTVFGSKSWTFNWTAPAQRVGKIAFYAAGNGANSDGTTNGDRIYTTSRATLSGSAISSFDGDGKSDVAIFRPSNGAWWNLNSTDGQATFAGFGQAGDKIAPGDYDGDGKTDRAVFRPSNGTWYLLQSTAGFAAVQFGTNGDVPVAGDYDGDLKTDIAVFRPSNGTWYLLQSSAGFAAGQFGNVSDRTAQGDYDGDGKTDIAVFRPSDGTWYLQQSTAGFAAVRFGSNGDQPVQADYDGDGKTDAAVFRPSNATWYMLTSSNGFQSGQWGVSTDKPAPADFDGDGKADLTVFRPSNGAWYILRSSDLGYTSVAFGTAGDIPVPAGYIAE